MKGENRGKEALRKKEKDVKLLCFMKAKQANDAFLGNKRDEILILTQYWLQNYCAICLIKFCIILNLRATNCGTKKNCLPTDGPTDGPTDRRIRLQRSLA